jgi:hypothetical protein
MERGVTCSSCDYRRLRAMEGRGAEVEVQCLS